MHLLIKTSKLRTKYNSMAKQIWIGPREKEHREVGNKTNHHCSKDLHERNTSTAKLCTSNFPVQFHSLSTLNVRNTIDFLLRCYIVLKGAVRSVPATPRTVEIDARLHYPWLHLPWFHHRVTQRFLTHPWRLAALVSKLRHSLSSLSSMLLNKALIIVDILCYRYCYWWRGHGHGIGDWWS